MRRRQRSYDRRRILDEAGRAAGRGRKKRAIACYRQVLAVEPRNPELHRRLAPLLATTGQHFDAWLSFRTAAALLLREGKAEQALALHRDAAHRLPRNVEAWRVLAQLQAQRGRRREALETLREGSKRLEGRRDRPKAIHLLRKAMDLAPRDAPTILALAALLRRSGQREEAHLLLERLAQAARGLELRRVRAAQLRLSPGVSTAWRWLRAVLDGEARAGAMSRARG